MKINQINIRLRIIAAVITIMCGIPSLISAQLRYSISQKDNVVKLHSAGITYNFTGNFVVIYSEKDPKLELRPAGIPGVSYNVPTWNTYSGDKSDLRETHTDKSVAGDGFDNKVLQGKQEGRTVRIQNGGKSFNISPTTIQKRGDTIVFVYESSKLFGFKAQMVLIKDGNPMLQYTLMPHTSGYFSVGYQGAPSFRPDKISEIWQPLIWQEKRFPDNAYITMAFRAPLPTTLVNDGHNSIGVLAAPSEFPFDPLPVFLNSRFGIAVRNLKDEAQPQLFAPVLGGIGSLMKSGEPFSFKSYILVEPEDITHTYESVARKFYGFRDYRHNDISSLNATFERMTAYALSDYAWFIDSLKGCAYSTDVPGAVKNVSSLNPMELALVTDNDSMFEKRAYPVMEYMLSREKLLFSLDSNQKIQSPSRKMNGPVAPLSELVSLYDIFGKDQGFLLQMAKKEFNKNRIRNLDEEQKGNSWMNAMYLYRATLEPKYLEIAKAGADDYIKNRVIKGSSAFSDQYVGSMFFWPTFTNRWVELLELYEITHDQRYLNAAHDGARHYTMFTWMSPAIPDSNILVNPDGKAPIYWYMKQKGHHQMYYPEEWAPAWRLSAIGLTPESSGTSSGHRAIFMANYAPWMLRIGYYTKDTFLMQVAKAAIIGRYRNFPGYHINTARTTAYEKADFPYHQFMDQSVTSFHYNHIMPMASMLLDYLVSDVFVRSKEAISYPAEYIEGYAYLKNNFYGSHTGSWYGDDGVQLWMPSGLLQMDSPELNYISGRKGDTLYIAFTNQSSQVVTSNVKLASNLVRLNGPVASLYYWQNNQFKRKQELPVYSNSLPVEVQPGGITVVKISGVTMTVNFQNKFLQKKEEWQNDYKEMEFGHARAMIFNMGGLGKRAYIWLGDDDNVFRNVTITYRDNEGRECKIIDHSYPFEFTVPLDSNQTNFQFQLSGQTVQDKITQSKIINLTERAIEK